MRKIKNLGHFLIAWISALYFRFPAKNLFVIGVTGTDGKTTTSTLIYSVLRESQKKTALISTVAAFIGDEEIDTGFHVTSPGPWQLQKLLRKIVEMDYKFVVLEATSHGLDQSRLYGTNISIGVLTNITHEHLDYHKTYDNYLLAKSKLFKEAKFAVLNSIDKSYEKIKKTIKGAKIITYNNSNIPLYIKSKFNESYNRLNAMAAVTVAQILKIEEGDIKKGIAEFKGIPGRMEVIKNNKDIRVFVDFAHTPNALEKSLKALRVSTQGKLIAVFGCAGLRDISKRPLMGEIGSRLADEVILTSEDPRSEDVNTIITQIKSGIKINHGHVHAIIDRKEAIQFALINLAQKGDTVGIFGKGHEKTINLDGKNEIPWSDVDEAAKALKMI